MPNTRYRHYKWHRRIKDYPFTHAVALAMFASAIVMLMAYGPNPFDDGLVSLLGVFAIPATLLILIGLQWKGQVIIGHGIEESGHWLAIGAWLINTWVLVMLGGTFTVISPVIFIFAHAFRGYRLHKEIRRIRDNMRGMAGAAGRTVVSNGD